jgi:hypothetical protein
MLLRSKKHGCRDKMSTWRLVVGAILFLTGLVLGGMEVYDARYWSALVFFIAGASSAVSFIVWEFGASSVSWVSALIGVAFSVVSIIDVFGSSPALDFEQSKAQVDFFQKLLELDADPSGLDENERKLVGQALYACAMQSNRDFRDLTINANKAIKMGPNATLADGVNSAIDPDKRVRCLDYFQKLYKTQPVLFESFVNTYPWLLNKNNGKTL